MATETPSEHFTRIRGLLHTACCCEQCQAGADLAVQLRTHVSVVHEASHVAHHLHLQVPAEGGCSRGRGREIGREASRQVSRQCGHNPVVWGAAAISFSTGHMDAARGRRRLKPGSPGRER